MKNLKFSFAIEKSSTFFDIRKEKITASGHHALQHRWQRWLRACATSLRVHLLLVLHKISSRPYTVLRFSTCARKNAYSSTFLDSADSADSADSTDSADSADSAPAQTGRGPYYYYYY